MEAYLAFFDRDHRCDSCGKADFSHTVVDVIDGMCSDCEDTHVYCCICKEWMPEDSTCRHLLWVDDEGWGGSGGAQASDDQFKRGIHALLSKFPSFAQPLADGLLESRYYFGFRGSFFGWDSISIELPQQLPYGFMDELFSGCIDDWKADARSGLSWLVTLWGGRGDWPEGATPAAAAQTLGWVEEWMAANALAAA